MDTQAQPQNEVKPAPNFDPIVCIVAGVTGSQLERVRASEVVETIRASEVVKEQIESIRWHYNRILNAEDDNQRRTERTQREVDPIKKQLPGILWSVADGTVRKRNTQWATAHSGVLCADLDHLNPAQLAEAIKVAHTDPHVLTCFISPKGDGLKICFRVQASLEKHAASWHAVREHVLKVYGHEIDKACKDPERLCFASSDPNVKPWVSDAVIVPPLAEPPAKPHTNGNGEVKPKAKRQSRQSRNGDDFNLKARIDIAEELLGDIDWEETEAGKGRVECPNIDEHTTVDADTDCVVYLRGTPTISCFHSHCQPGTPEKPGGLDEINHELRSLIGKAESKGKKESSRKLTGETVEPWDMPVDTRTAVELVLAFAERYMVIGDDELLALISFVLVTWVFPLCDYQYVPILHVTSPEKECGKSRLLDMLKLLVRQPVRTSNCTGAALYRIIEKLNPSLLIDEYDSLSRSSEELKEAIRNVLNSGFERDNPATRCAKDNLEVEQYKTFCPKVVAGIGDLPDTAASRAIRIALKRKLPSEKVERLRKVDTTDLRRKLAKWAQDHAKQLEDANPAMPEELGDREQDIWEPLIAIMDLAGYGKEARIAALELCGRKSADNESLRVQLLADIRHAFRREKKITSNELLECLARMDDHPWCECCKGDKPITARYLSNLLRPLGIGPISLALGEMRAKGYSVDQFTDAFARYLKPADTKTKA